MLVVFGVLAAADVMAARSISGQAIAEGREALSQLVEGDLEQGEASLTSSADRLAEAAGRLDRPWVDLSQLVPVFGSEITAAESGILAARDGARAGLTLFAFLEADRPPLFSEGRLSGEAMSVLEVHMEDALSLARSARDHLKGSPTPRTATVTRYTAELDEITAGLIPILEGAHALVGDLAEAASGGNPYRALLVVENGAELRATGGLPGLLGLIRVDGEGIVLERSDIPNELEVPRSDLRAALAAAPEGYGSRYLIHLDNDEPFLNLGMSPDFPTVAEMTDRLYQEVIGIDPQAIAHIDLVGLGYLLKALPPIEVEGRTLEAESLARQFLIDSYLRFEGKEHNRFLGRVVDEAVEAVLSGREINPQELVVGIRRAVAERRLALVSDDPEVTDMAAQLNATGAMLPGEPGDMSIVLQNLNGNKLDLFSDVDYQVSVEGAECQVTGRIRIVLRNEVEPEVADQLPSFYWPDETRRRLAIWWVSIYLPREGNLASLTKDGENALGTKSSELGRPVASTFARAMPGESVVIEAAWWEELQTDRYTLRLQPQPMVEFPRLTVNGESEGRLRRLWTETYELECGSAGG